MASPVELDALSSSELKALAIELLGKVAALEQAVAAQREAIARLKGLKGRPALRPSGMEQAGATTPSGGAPDRRGLVAQLRAFGLAISKRQVMRLLVGSQQAFLDESRAVLRTGLRQAAWLTVDDTGARHRAANGLCTQIGNDHVAWFATTPSRNRLNFLELLHAGDPDYVVNAEAL